VLSTVEKNEEREALILYLVSSIIPEMEMEIRGRVAIERWSGTGTGKVKG
jgi:hypothetical protein